MSKPLLISNLNELGYVPAGELCFARKACKYSSECLVGESTIDRDFSCGLARLFHLMWSNDDE